MMRLTALTLVLTLALPAATDAARRGGGHAHHAAHHKSHHAAHKRGGHKGHHAPKHYAARKAHHAGKHHAANHAAGHKHVRGRAAHHRAIARRPLVRRISVARKSVHNRNINVARSSSRSYSSSGTYYGGGRTFVGGSYVGPTYVGGIRSTSVVRPATSSVTIINGGAKKKPGPKFLALFNGKDLDGWTHRGTAAAFVVENGLLVATGGPKGWAVTAGDYRNFEMKLKYRTPAPADTAIAVRLADQGKVAEVGTVINLTGSTVAAAVKPPGEWNELRVTARGTVLSVELNGQFVLESTAARPNGHVALQSDRGRVEFRDLYVRELP